MNGLTGKWLYLEWAGFMAEQGIEVDSWSDIDDSDRESWNRLAEAIPNQMP